MPDTLLAPDILSETDTYRVRLLPPEEWDARAEELLHYPQLPDPQFAVLVVVEQKSDGRIVASWFAMTQVLLEGLYVVPDARQGQTAIQRLLLGGMLDVLHQAATAQVLTLAQDPAILALARKAGFTPVEGTLLLLRLPRKDTI